MKKFLFATTILLGTAVAVSAQAKVAKPATKMEKVKITDADQQVAEERAKNEKVKRAQKASAVTPMTYADQEGNKDSKTAAPAVKSKAQVKAKAIKAKKAE